MNLATDSSRHPPARLEPGSGGRCTFGVSGLKPLGMAESMSEIRDDQPRPRSWMWVAGVASILIALGAVATFVSLGLTQRSHVQPAGQAKALLPQPIPQPITRTSAGAQVAWLWVQSQGQSASLVAVDPRGRLVARLDQSAASGIAGNYGIWRSADGSSVFAVGSDQVTAYSALDGKVQRTYARAPGSVVGDAFSPDGRWLAILTLEAGLRLQVIDLLSGSSQVLPVGHDPNASLPGMSCSGVAGGSCADTVAWGLAAFAPDSTHLYTLSDWGGPARLTAYSFEGGKLSQTATAVDGQNSSQFSTCGAPAMAASIVADGKTLVAFCHMDGSVWFFDLGTLANSGVIRAQQGNPFWNSPIFTPDGQLLYLQQVPGFGNSIQVIDLTTRRLLGPVSTPTKVNQAGPFAWLIGDAYAGGVASTVPLSPDGLKLYSATGDGVMVFRVPDLKALARLAPGLRVGEVWISGDGRTVYATSDDGKRVVVVSSDGSGQKSVLLPSLAGGFIASEHG
jgi:WD40 repeat protein